MKLLFRTIIWPMLILSSCSVSPKETSEKTLINHLGPTSFSIEEYTGVYLKLPSCLSEVADYIDWRERNVTSPKNSNSEKRLWKIFCKELRRNNRYYSFFNDSALFFRSSKSYYEKAIFYDPRYLLEQFPYLSPKERIEKRAITNDRLLFYDSNGCPYYTPDSHVLYSRIDSLRNARTGSLCRLIGDMPWPYQTIIVVNKNQTLSFYQLRLSDSESIIISYGNDLKRTFITAPEIPSFCSTFFSDIFEIMNDFFSQWPEIQSISFVSILMI